MPIWRPQPTTPPWQPQPRQRPGPPPSRVVVTPDAIALSTAMLAPRPIVTPFPSVIALTASLLAPRPTPKALPSSVSLAASLLAPSPLVRALLGGLSLSTTLPAPRPVQTVPTGLVALSTSVLAPSLKAAALPDAISLALAMQAPRPRLIVVPGSGAVAAQALALTGAEYLSRGHESALAVGDVDWLVAFWVRINGTQTGWQSMVTKDNSGARGFGFWKRPLADGGEIELDVGDQGLWDPAFGAFPSDTWKLIVGYHDSVNNLIGITIDNAAFVTDSYSTPPTDGGYEWRFGHDGWNSGKLVGNLQHVLFCKNPPSGIAGLCTTIRDRLWNSGAGIDGSDLTPTERSDWGLVEWWRLDESSGTRRGLFAGLDLSQTGSPGSDTGHVASTTAPPAVGVQLGITTPAPTPKLRALPSSIALSLATQDELPRIIALPASVPLVWTLYDPTVTTGGGAVTATPDSIVLAVALFNPSSSLHALPSSVALTLAMQDARPRLTAYPSSVPLILSVQAALARIAGLPGSIPLGVALFDPALTLRALPDRIALSLAPMDAIPTPTVFPSSVGLSWTLYDSTRPNDRRVYPETIGLVFVVRLPDIFKPGEVWYPPQVDVGDAILETVGLTDGLVGLVGVVDVLIGGTVQVTDQGLYVVGVGDSQPTPVGAGDVAAAEVGAADRLLGGVGVLDIGPISSVEVTDQNVGGSTGVGDTQLGLVQAGDIVLQVGVTDRALSAVGVDDLGDA